MIYLWLIILTAAVIYLYYAANTLSDCVDTLQELALEKLEKFSADLAVYERKMEDLFTDIENTKQ